MKWRRSKPDLGSILCDAAAIDAAGAARLAAERAPGEPFCLAAVRLQLLSERRLFAALAERLSVPAVEAETFAFDAAAADALPQGLRSRADLWALKLNGKSLTLAMADPSDEGLVQSIAKATGLSVRPMLAPLWGLRDAHRRAAAAASMQRHMGRDKDLVRYLVFFEGLADYRFEAVLGSGGFGLVCRCWQPDLKRSVAIKVLNPDWNPVAQVTERFKREGQIIAQLDHPNIIRVHEQGERDGYRYIVMEHFAGEPLDKHLAGKQWGRKQSALLQVCHAVGYAHARGVIHRDIKPANILVDAQGQVKLLDFGIAHCGDGAGLTGAQMVLGTPKYMAPELSRGAGHSGPASDLYAFGVMAYEIVCGRRFDPSEAIHPARAEGRCPRALGDRILACVAADPRKRPADFKEMARTIQSAMDQMVFGSATAEAENAPTRGPAAPPAIEPIATLREDAGCKTILAFNKALGCNVVVKILDRPGGEGSLEKTAGLRDFHIGEVYSVGRLGRRIVVVSEHLGGGSLADKIGGAHSPREAIEWLKAVATALYQAHRAGIVHGGLHPRNALFHAEGALKVVDFMLRPAPRADVARYCAPQALADPVARDWHSLGAIAYELICGGPFPGGLAYARYFAPLSANAKHHPLLKYFLGRLWRIRESDPPYPDGQAVLLDLERILNRLMDQPNWTGDGAPDPSPRAKPAGSWLSRTLAGIRRPAPSIPA